MPSTVGTTTTLNATTVPFQRRSFYAAGRYWVFYSDGTNFGYRTSTDGISWSDFTILFTSSYSSKEEVQFDGTYLHYVRIASGVGDGSTKKAFYRRGVPESDGTITWSAAEQGVYAPASGYTISEGATVCVDNDGYPFIGFCENDGTNYASKVTKSSTNDGTWVTEDGFPVTLSTASYAYVLLIPLTSSKVYALLLKSAVTIKGKLWDGSSWGSEETVTTSNLYNPAGTSAVNEGDHIHLVFLRTSNYNILYVKRTYGTGWGSEVIVQSATMSTIRPILSINPANNDLYCFWAGSPTTDHIYYKKCVGGAWDTDPTDWIDESTDHLTDNNKTTGFYKAFNNYIGLVYTTKTSSPYNVRFVYLTIAVVVEVSLAIPQVRMEIFRGPPALFDDNFVKGWNFNAVGADGLTGYSFTTDGDVVTINSGSGGLAGAWVQYVKAALGDTDIYKKAIVRARAKTANAQWCMLIYYSDATTDSTPWKDNTDFEIVTVALTAGKTIQYIYIYCKTTDGNAAEVEYDYVAICKEELLIPVDETKSDIVESLTITLPLLHCGVGGFSCKLPNMNGEYTGQISDFDHILIYLWRKGADMKKVFGGKILLPGTEGFGTSQEYYLLLSGMDIGQELLVPPNLLKKVYEAVNGKTIIEEAIDLCSEVTKKFVDVDGEIASTHDFEFQEVTPDSVIKDVCENAKTSGGAVGFDGYVDPAGNVHVFKRGKYTSGVSLAEKIEHYKKEDDVHRVRNKIKVYGAAERAYPLDKDAWTESLTPADGSWASGTGTGSVSLDASEKIVGDKSIKLIVGGSDYYGRLIFTLNAGKEANCYDVPDGYADITFQIKLQEAFSGDITLQLEDDAGMICRKELNAKKAEWVLINLACGRGAKDQWTYSPFNSQEFDWKKVKKVDITCHFPATGTGAFWVDNLFFNKRRFEGFAEDATSQGKYGVRWKEPIVDDGLKSDAECLKKAESFRDFLKEKVITLTDFEVEGDNGFNPGDKQLVAIPNDNINEYFRILEIRHVIRGVNWSTFLTLTNEPQFIDYVFMNINERLKRLEKRAGISIGAGGGGGGGAGPLFIEERSLAHNRKTGVPPGTETTIVSYSVGSGVTVTLKGFIGWGTCPAIYTLYSDATKKTSFMTSEFNRTAKVDKMEEKITGPKIITLKVLHYVPAAGVDDYHDFEGTLLGG